ncbi:hypothetical protein NE172_17520, partial [Clostridium botulinum]|nr:hypothetical protein [Clostridium botulinum]
VKPSVLEVNRSISTPTCTLMERLEKDLDKVRDLEFNFNEADKINKELKDTTIPNANKINTTLEENTKKATTSNTNLKDSTDTANSTKQAVDSSVIQANLSKQALDTSKVNADNTKKEVDAAIIVADEKIEIIKKLDPENVVEDVKKLKEQVLENTYTKIETDSTLTKLESCKDSFVHNMLLRGKTLQNLAMDTFLVRKEFVKVSSYVVKFNAVNNSDEDRYISVKDRVKYGIYSSSAILKPHENKEIIIYAKISDINGIGNLYLDILNPKYNPVNDVITTNVMCLEGDWTNREIPSYFEGIKSVGELEGNKISILSSDKNLFSINDKFTLKGSGDGTTEQVIVYDYFSYLEKGKNYTFSCKTDGVWGFNGSDTVEAYLLKDKKTDNLIQIRTNPYTFTCNVTGKYYLRLDINKNNTTHSFWDIQIEEGTTATSYEEYKEDKTEILLPSPHMGLPSGISDIVNFDKSERIKNVDKATFNGSEGWTLHPYSNSNFSLFYCYSVIGFFVNCLSNKFPLYHGSAESLKQETQEYIWGQGKGVFIWIKNDKLETPDANGFKKLLKSWADAGIPLEVYYQLETPVPEKLNIKDTLQSFENGYIQLDNAITPTAQLEYSTNIPSAIGGLTQVVDHSVDEITNIESTISDINIELGDEPLKTTSETIRGAINENTLELKEIEQNYYSLNNAIPIPSNSDLNNYTEPGNYFSAGSGISNTLTNCPFTDGAFALKVERITIGTAINLRQILKANSSNVITCERNCLNGTWLEKWKQLATVEDTGWIDLPLASGITVDGKITPQYRRVNNQVFICGSILGVDSTGKVVATLPVGFRPSRANYYVGFTTGTYTNAIRIDSNGNIIVQSNSSGTYDPTRFATLGTNFIT